MAAQPRKEQPRRSLSPRVRSALSGYRPRNKRVVDVWSFVHLASCAALTLVLGPFWAFVVALLWEPVEIKVLSPLLARVGIDFGHEDLKNSMSDLAFNGAGVLLAWFLVLPRFNPLGV